MLEWLMNHATEVVAVVGALHVIAAVIVNATPTPVDDSLLGKVYPWIEKAAGLLTAKAKQSATETTTKAE